ncbi:MAG: hypothetical protein WBN22_06435, partial [Verrucomicrobiia bacterium]
MNDCRREFGFDARPHLFPLPPGEDNATNSFWLANDRPANSVARIFRKAANDSPSPWGEGRDEGGREINSGLVARLGARSLAMTEIRLVALKSNESGGRRTGTLFLNSVWDERGNVIGIVSAKLDAGAALAASGALPENVNYAVKSS